MGQIKSLSPSKVEAAMKCLEQVRYRYKERVSEPSVGHLITGIIVHAVLEWALRKRLEGSPLPSKKEADDYFLETWKSKIAEEERKPSFLGWEWGEDSPELAHSECRALIPFALDEVLPDLKPKLIEENVKKQFGSPVGPYMMWGKLDLMEEGGLVTDWKTCKGEPSKNQKKMGLALPYYTFKSIEHGAPEISPCRKIFLMRGSKPNVEVVNYSVTWAIRHWFVLVSTEVWKAIQADAYIPSPNGWWCDPRFCSFWGICQGELV